MAKGSTLFLKGVIVLMGLFVLFLCVYGIPRVIGQFSLGGYDPILIGLYLPAVPFFAALYQAFNLLGLIEHNLTFTADSVKTLKYIKFCGTAISGLFLAGMPYIFYVADKDDAPGVVAIGLVIIFSSFVIAVFAAVLQRMVQNAVDIKKENDLTV